MTALYSPSTEVDHGAFYEISRQVAQKTPQSTLELNIRVLVQVQGHYEHTFPSNT